MEALQPVDETLANAISLLPSPEVIILYQDFPAGLAAKRFFDYLFRQIDPEGNYHLKMWEHQLLRHSILRAEAVQDAAGAAIICVSSSGAAEPDAALKLWAQSWARKTAAHPCTLVALLGEPERASGPLTNFLRQIAKRKQAEFFLGSTSALEQGTHYSNRTTAIMDL